MEGLMLHCGAESASWDAVCNAPMPQSTASYSTVPYKDMVEMTIERNFKEFRIAPEDQEWSFGLQDRGDKGSRFFAVCRLRLDEKDWGLAQGLRGSTDKSMSNGFASGASVFVCDNLAFHGSSLSVTRKHTGDAYNEFRSMLLTGIADSLGSYESVSSDLNKLKTVGCEQNRGFEMLGLAMGLNVLAKQEVSTALDEWKNPSHEEHSERNMYSLYNSFTEAAKRTRAPSAQFNKYSGIHGFFGEYTDVEFKEVS